MTQPGQTTACGHLPTERLSTGLYARDGWAMDGRHGRHECAVQGVVEDR